MTRNLLNRPVAKFNPAKGLLHSDHFQIGYVTNDIARAEAIFRDRFGVTQFRCRDNDLQGGASISTRTVWIGAMMFELCCGKGPGMEYFCAPPAADDGFVMQLHHFGYLIACDADWQSLEDRLEREQWHVASRSEIAGFHRTIMVAAPELGHMLEFIQPHEGLAAQMNQTPMI